jgi:hypothetical protein
MKMPGFLFLEGNPCKLKLTLKAWDRVPMQFFCIGSEYCLLRHITTVLNNII